MTTPLPSQLVTTSWLADELDSPDLRILDCTVIFERNDGVLNVESGRRLWESGHIPGGDHVDLLTRLSDQTSEHRFMMPSEYEFVSQMQTFGVGDGTRVVLYDRDRNMWAARVWWMLRQFGFTEAAVLDGGWASWTREGHEVATSAAPIRERSRFTVRPSKDVFVDRTVVLDAIGAEGPAIVNALSAEQHNGENLDYDRRGHIPGALNSPAGDLVDPDTHQYLRMDELSMKMAPLRNTDSVIFYCGGGISASSAAFALRLLGQDDVTIYDASMSEWGADPSLPLEY